MTSAPSSLILSDVDRRLEVPGFVLTETYRPAGLVLPMHFHAHANVALTLQGGFIETVGAKPYEVNPASVIFRPAGEKHSNRYGKSAAHCLIIEVKPERLAAIRAVTQILERASYVEGRLVSDFALRILREFQMPDAISPLAIEALVLEMLVQCARRPPTPKGQPPRWLQMAKDIVHERFSDSLSLSAVARLLGVHPANLAKMFRSHYHSTVGDYIRGLRLDRAAELLVRSEQSLSAIALSAGFYDQSHFARLFKLRFSVTPGAFRAGLRTRPTPVNTKHRDLPPD
jgi:AraC family transcriptional regulator